MSEHVCENGHHIYGGDNYEPSAPCEECGSTEWEPVIPSLDAELRKEVVKRHLEKKHAVCQDCGKPMDTGVGCTLKELNRKKMVYGRIPYGEEKRMHEGLAPEYVKGMFDTPCHDCNVTKGQYHHLGCDMEECPRCGGQLISCDCPFDYKEEE